MAYLAVALGGALGAMSRFWVYNGWLASAESRLPIGTLLINVSGSLLIGILYVLIVERHYMGSQWQNILAIGFLGAFTTFSTFSIEAVRLMENGQAGIALAYVFGSLLLCLFAAWTGLQLTRILF